MTPKMSVAVISKPETLSGHIRGFSGGLKNASGELVPISVSCPSYGAFSREGLPAEATSAEHAKARAMLGSLYAVKRLHEIASSGGRSFSEVAADEARKHRKALEGAWVGMRAQNRSAEVRVRQLAGLFTNMGTARLMYARRLHFFGISGAEVASQRGAELLKDYLSQWADRPDPRLARSFVLVPGWVGSSAALKRMKETIHEARAVFVSDAPELDTLAALKQASDEGGPLEDLPGRTVADRHTFLYGNPTRARRAFRGEFASEADDFFIQPSALHFGAYLKNIALGVAWKPSVGFQHPLEGVDGVKVDLVLGRNAAGLYSKWRINPALLAAAGSERVLVWGADTLYSKGRGAQMGVAVVETLLARYSEFVINKHGMLEDLDEARDVVEGKLAAFLAMNSGAGRMFLMPSRVRVSVDERTRTLLVRFQLRFREVAERAKIELTATLPIDKSRVSVQQKDEDDN